jgi:serine/threonine-protein kinase
VALVTGAAVWRVREPVEASRPLTRFSIDLFDRAQQLTIVRNPVAISPDGTHIVYAANQRLYVRAMDQPEATAIPGTEGGGAAGSTRDPFFSPDSQWIGFWQDAQLKKVAVAGGAPVTICSGVPDAPVGISWEQDEILWDSPKGIMRVAPAGGTPELLIGAKAPELIGLPQMLPGNEWLLLTVSPTGAGVEQSQAVVQSRKTGERRVLVEAIREAQYVSSGTCCTRAGRLSWRNRWTSVA